MVRRITWYRPSRGDVEGQRAIGACSLRQPDRTGFWVDQDSGWTVAYFTPPDKNFIADQRQEVIRFMTGLPPRHPFRDKSDYDRAKENAERTQRHVDIQRGVVERLRVNGQFVHGRGSQLQSRGVTPCGLTSTPTVKPLRRSGPSLASSNRISSNSNGSAMTLKVALRECRGVKVNSHSPCRNSPAKSRFSARTSWPASYCVDSVAARVAKCSPVRNSRMAVHSCISRTKSRI